MTVPCKDCPDRAPACHGRCGRYAAYRAEMDKAAKRREKALDDDAYSIEKMRRMQRKQHKPYKAQ